MPLAVFVGLVLVWEATVKVLHVQPIVLPPPSGVALTMAQTAGPIAFHAWHTLVTTLLGFVAAVGVSNLVVVETDDALLITTLDRSQDVGKVVKHLDEKKLKKLV